MRKCSACGAAAPAKAQFCPNCGRRIVDVAPTQMLDARVSLVAARSGYLEFLGGPEDGRIDRLPGEEVTIGRREDNDIQIYSDSALSRRHARVFRRDEQFWIQDRKSSFGTWVDGERVPSEESAPLADGSLVRLARTLFVFYLGEPEVRDASLVEARAAQV
jgi:pSer/pThr/pTyr-binding forkhead associated (FHA) protein